MSVSVSVTSSSTSTLVRPPAKTQNRLNGVAHASGRRALRDWQRGVDHPTRQWGTQKFPPSPSHRVQPSSPCATRRHRRPPQGSAGLLAYLATWPRSTPSAALARAGTTNVNVIHTVSDNDACASDRASSQDISHSLYRRSSNRISGFRFPLPALDRRPCDPARYPEAFEGAI